MLRVGLASDVGQVRLRDIRPLADIHEERRKLLATRHQTGDQIHTRGRTTRGTARMEQALSMHLALGLNDASPIASSERLLAAFERAGLTPAQEQAVAMVATSQDRVNGIHGVAGAGKSTIVKVLREAAGHNTIAIALAPTSSAAAELGVRAGIESRTIASLLARGVHNLTASHLLVVDEAGQLGNRQALRVLELSRATGARVLFLGDNKQTGAIEQGKAFWLLQRLGLPTAQLTESVRQETKALKTAVTQARLGNYAASLAALDGVVTGETPEALAKALVGDWTRLGQKSREGTNILVLENATRLIVNSKIREVLKREGVIAAEDTRLSVLTSSGMTDEEKRYARFYSAGQVVTFGRDGAGLRIERDTEYRVVEISRAESGRQIVKLQDEHGRLINWDPRLGSVRRVNVFNREDRQLANGDRIQWRLVNHELGLKNAQRGTVVRLEGTVATIRWDRTENLQEIDLARHKTWDHGYAETVYSAQSKTYARVYVLAPVQSRLVNGQNYYTAITRARFGARIWTEDPGKLVTKLEENSGEKTSSLEGLSRLDRDSVAAFSERHTDQLSAARLEQGRTQAEHRERVQARGFGKRTHDRLGPPEQIADRALSIAQHIERILLSVLGRDGNSTRDPQQSGQADHTSQRVPEAEVEPDRAHGPDR